MINALGYNVHITRAQNWYESEENPISLDEWKAYIESDPEMRLDGFAKVMTPDGILRYENEGLAVWKLHSRHGAGGKAWINWSRSQIDVKNPDVEMHCKMFAIATALAARVQGDEGELYDARGKMVR